MDLCLFFPIIIGLIFIFAEYIYLSHPEKKFKKKILGGNMDYVQLLLSFILPFLLNSVIFFDFLFILARPKTNIIPIPDWLVVYSAFVCALLSAIGLGIHLAAKGVSWTLKNKEDSDTYKVNRFFHGRFSHDLIYVPTPLFFFLLMIVEMGHPLGKTFSNPLSFLLIILGGLTGASAMTLLVWVNSSGYASLRPMLYFFSLILVSTALFIFNYSLKLNRLPWSLFFISAVAASTLTTACLSFNKFRRKLITRINTRLAGY